MLYVTPFNPSHLITGLLALLPEGSRRLSNLPAIITNMCQNLNSDFPIFAYTRASEPEASVQRRE